MTRPDSHARTHLDETARIVAALDADVLDDEGWDTVLVNWLKGSRLRRGDLVLVFSVSGRTAEKNISRSIISALTYAKDVGAEVVGVVGRDGGYSPTVADECVIVPTVNAERVTPHTDAFQAIVWHLLVSHPLLKTGAIQWESTR